MGKELAPRTYDERVSLADAERRCRRELRQGASLSAVVRTLQSRRSYGVPAERLTDRDFYRVVQTGLVVDGRVVMSFRYRSDGRVVGSSLGLDGAAATAEWPATLPGAGP